MGARRVGPRRVGPRRVGARNFALFFSLSRHSFLFFFPSLLVFFVEFWWCLKHRLKCARLEFSGCRVRAPAARFPREDTQRDTERAKRWREREKKSEILGGPAEGGGSGGGGSGGGGVRRRGGPAEGGPAEGGPRRGVRWRGLEHPPHTHNKHKKMDWPKMDWPKLDLPKLAKPLTTNL